MTACQSMKENDSVYEIQKDGLFIEFIVRHRLGKWLKLMMFGQNAPSEWRPFYSLIRGVHEDRRRSSSCFSKIACCSHSA